VSGHGAPELGRVEGAESLRVAVIASQWHTQVMDGLLAGAQRALAESGVSDVTVVRVPGAFELTVAAARLARGDFDALVVLGVVIRGGTPHFDYVCQSATEGVTAITASMAIPIGFGLLTCDTEEQALDRAGLPGSAEDKGFEATVAALATAVTLGPYPVR
jgi:6,7-dimethyl-8-ribityllumazine synthase